MARFEETSRSAEIGGSRLHYHEDGHGAPLVMLHGSGPGVTGWANFGANLPAFAGQYRCLIPDLPGYGRSDAIDGDPVAGAAEAIVRFMDTLGIERAHVIGNSYGAIVASLLAARHPARVSRFIAIGGIGFNLFSPFPAEGINLLVKFIADPTRERLREWLGCMVFDQSLVTDALLEERFAQAMDPKTMATSRKLYSPESIAAIAAATRGPAAAQSFAHLRAIEAPTLLTWGREDRVNPLDRALLPLQLIPDCALHVFPRCGHWAMIERKAEFESIALAFLGRS